MVRVGNDYDYSDELPSKVRELLNDTTYPAQLLDELDYWEMIIVLEEDSLRKHRLEEEKLGISPLTRL